MGNPAKPRCVVYACGRPARARGFAAPHYLRLLRTNDVRAHEPIRLVKAADMPRCGLWPKASSEKILQDSLRALLEESGRRSRHFPHVVWTPWELDQVGAIIPPGGGRIAHGEAADLALMICRSVGAVCTRAHMIRHAPAQTGTRSSANHGQRPDSSESDRPNEQSPL